MKKAILVAALILAGSGLASAQNLGENLGQVSSQYARAYVTPAANAFGADLNSGLFHTASVGGALPFGLKVYVGVQVAGAFVPSSDKSFSLTYQDTMEFTDPLGISHRVPATFTTTNAPTIFGSKTKGTIKITPNDSSYRAYGESESSIGGLISASIAPIPIPQIGLGSLFGTDVVVRFLPKIKYQSYGSVQMFGLAVRHDISQYIPFCPVDIAAEIGFQNLGISDSSGSSIFKTSTFAANLEVSKTFAVVTVYGGLQVESSSADVNYTYAPYQNAEPVSVSFDIKGKNKFRALAGLDFGFGPLTINADYNLGSVSVANVGIGVTI